MPKTKISEYSTTNTDNSDIESINIAEGCAPSGINNAIRELMVHLKEFQTGSSGDPLTVAGAFVASGGTTANTMSVTGILTASGGTVLSGTNTMSGSAVISGNINSSGSSNTFSGGVVHSGTNTFSSSVIISGNINSSGTNTFSGSQIISGSINSSGSTNTFSGNTIFSVNSSSDAVRITQTGAGNALVVEDSANPDSTPFVVNASGQVLVGLSTTLPGSANGSISILSEGSSAPNGNINGRRYSNDTTGLTWGIGKARGTFASPTIVQSGDSIGTYVWTAYDGTTFLTAAQITAVVDGTPGTNDMPGFLVFSTTADGASSPTERMRIDSAGNVGIGGTAFSGQSFTVKKNITGSADSGSISTVATIQSDVTSSAYGFSTNLSTNATSFTLSFLPHYEAKQGTFGAGSTVTNQYGFSANSSLTGATNNYGFYSDIASGTGRWNFYANGTAQNYFEGTTNFKASQSSLPTYRGYIRLGAHGSQSLNTDGGIEFVATTFSNGYGYRISAPDLGGGSVPMVFENRMDSATWTERMRITAVGNVLIGGTATRGTTAGTNHLSIFNGTAPAGTLTNGVTFYSDAGEAKVMDAAGNATLLSPHDPVTNEWIYYSVHTPTGKKLRIDMEKMMRFLNDHFDLDFVHEE